MASIVIKVDFGNRTTAQQRAAAASDATTHPVMAPLVDKLPELTRARVRRILSAAAAEGLTAAQAARQVRELGIDARAAQAISRTGLAVIADRSRSSTLGDF